MANSTPEERAQAAADRAKEAAYSIDSSKNEENLQASLSATNLADAAQSCANFAKDPTRRESERNFFADEAEIHAERAERKAEGRQ